MRWIAALLTLAVVALAGWCWSLSAEVERGRLERIQLRRIDDSLDRIASGLSSFGERLTRVEAWRDGDPIPPKKGTK